MKNYTYLAKNALRENPDIEKLKTLLYATMRNKCNLHIDLSPRWHVVSDIIFKSKYDVETEIECPEPKIGSYGIKRISFQTDKYLVSLKHGAFHSEDFGRQEDLFWTVALK